MDIFFANKSNIFLNKLHNQIKNSSRVEYFKIKLDEFRNNGKKNKSRGYFWELLDEIFNRI